MKTAKSDNPTEYGLHLFQRAGLGLAPFEFVGHERRAYQASPDAPVQPGGSCAYCGTGIIDCFKLRSRDGHNFIVGSDCIAKAGDDGVIKAYKTSPEYRVAQAQKRAAKDEAVRAEIERLMDEKREALSAQMRKRWDGSDESFYSYLLRVLPMCGASGRRAYLKAIKAA